MMKKSNTWIGRSENSDCWFELQVAARRNTTKKPWISKFERSNWGSEDENWYLKWSDLKGGTEERNPRFLIFWSLIFGLSDFQVRFRFCLLPLAIDLIRVLWGGSVRETTGKLRGKCCLVYYNPSWPFALWRVEACSLFYWTMLRADCICCSTLWNPPSVAPTTLILFWSPAVWN